MPWESAPSRSRPATYLEGAHEEFFSVMNATNIDLKAFSDGFYRKFFAAELAPVLENAEICETSNSNLVGTDDPADSGFHHDSPDEIDRLGDWIVREFMGPDVPLHFTAFHPDYRLTDVPATSPDILPPSARTGASSRIALRVHGKHSGQRGPNNILCRVRNSCHTS